MRIAIDPGHGMSAATPGRYDPGAVAADGTHEADIALAWALEVERLLLAQGADPWLTRRTKEEVLPTRLRAATAARMGCEAFLSIHCNAFTSPGAHGTEVLYGSPAAAPQAARLSAELSDVMGTRHRGIVLRPRLAVLRFRPGLALLVELGFISNLQDLARMIDPEIRVRGSIAMADIFFRLAKEHPT